MIKYDLTIDDKSLNIPELSQASQQAWDNLSSVVPKLTQRLEEDPKEISIGWGNLGGWPMLGGEGKCKIILDRSAMTKRPDLIFAAIGHECCHALAEISVPEYNLTEDNNSLYEEAVGMAFFNYLLTLKGIKNPLLKSANKFLDFRVDNGYRQRMDRQLHKLRQYFSNPWAHPSKRYVSLDLWPKLYAVYTTLHTQIVETYLCGPMTTEWRASDD